MIDGNLVRSARFAAQMTQNELSSMSGVRQPRISNIENNRYKPSIETMYRLAVALNITMISMMSEAMVIRIRSEIKARKDGSRA